MKYRIVYGSGGTTAIAALKTGRDFIGIEKDKDCYDIAVNRLNDEKAG